LVLLVAVAIGGATARTGRDGPDERYYHIDEVLAFFDTWAADYPDIFHREIIGYTLVENEPIWAARISDNASVDEPEASIFIHAAQHSNEANGTNAIVYMMDRLLTGYGEETYYTEMIDDLEMWFVPIVNIDGHRIVFEGEPNWDWWRKTKRDNDGNDEYTFPEDGVDPNRNWDYRWAQYDSTDYRSSRYKGPYPFSETEVVAVRDFVLRERPVFLMDLHSPDVPSIGNKIWWPWFDPDTYQYSPDRYIYHPICQTLGNRTKTETGGYYNGNGPCYNKLPKEQCWVYANTGICTFLMEISLQFWWTGATVDTIAHRVGRGLFYLMERSRSGPGLTGIVTGQQSGQPIEAEIKVHQVHDDDIGPRMTEAEHGQYWRLLLPNATYTVTASAEDHESQTQNIYVGASGWTHLDFVLVRDPSAVDPFEGEMSRRLWADSPLRSGRSIYFTLAEPSEVSLDLVDISGRHVATLMTGFLPAGMRAVVLRERVPAGAYLLRLRVGDEQLARKVIVVE
jgi:hypothetical protein